MGITPQTKVAILLHGGIFGKKGKTGLAFLRYSNSQVVVIIDVESAGGSLAALTGINRNIPIVSNVAAALAYKPDVLLIGIAPSGGLLPENWWQEVKQGLDVGLSVVNGLHSPLANKYPHLKPGQWIWDIRQEPPGLKIGQGKARNLNCQRILTVGTDMAVGKMSTSLEIYHAAKRQGIKAEFLATGQAGIMIAGDGIPLDAVRVDYAAGAVEQLVIKYGKNCQLLMIEGQGSLLHPGSTATLPLIRGSQPTGLILVHRAKQKHINDLPDFLIPPLAEVVKLYETIASAACSFENVKVKAIALNTFGLDSDSATKEIQLVEKTTGLPCTDVVRYGAKKLISAIINS
ncbi:MAG: DUF1611 domain-containing protein [Cyanobacteria bacterium J083]|nr:MAG: DUF1611 domain-containing protein [Cyanobacteria bacterium J083]